MVLKDILSIAGKPGLFKYISQGRGGVIVESLLDGKRMLANSSQRVSSLEDIAMFTSAEEVPLAKVFDAIFTKENGGKSLEPKSSEKELVAYFETILPDYDRDRVYVSDIKKVFAWYNLLHSKSLLIQEPAADIATEADSKDGEGNAASEK